MGSQHDAGGFVFPGGYRYAVVVARYRGTETAHKLYCHLYVGARYDVAYDGEVQSVAHKGCHEQECRYELRADVAFYGYLFAVAFAYMNYSHLPILDFRPYKVGANIPALMAIPEGAPVDEYDYSFIYEKDGVQKEFSLENIPSNDSSWVFVESKTKLIKQGYVPPVVAFNVYDMRDEDVTEQLFSNPDPMFLLVSPHLEEADDERIDEINSIYDYAVERGWSFYCITGSSEEAMSAWTDNTGAEYPYLFADEVLLKTIIRSNPGLVLMREGTILGKWHYNDFPSAEALETAFDPYLTGNYDRKSEEDAKLLTNLLTFILPLSLVWVYDGFRFRRRKRKADN